jgi:phosphohistidine phosphatase
MLIYLVRHAIAVPRDELASLDDASRALTDRGIERMQRVVRGLAKLDVHLDEIWSSSLTRARQTAELLADLPGFHGRVRIVSPLAPGGALHDVVRDLQQVSRRAHVALVGHEPDMGELAGLLLTGSPRHFMPFKKGGVACVELEDAAPPMHGTLRWFATPRQLRRLG